VSRPDDPALIAGDDRECANARLGRTQRIADG
jgi:hypothetical protein